ncbi:MAG TPA: T9SS type A sorting domain-containing protein, partial [Chitinophagales bacterium]|nr:T9SS type A sorting domain-containing protein [Chitinophagales bacterium]
TMHTAVWEIDKIITKQLSADGDTITYGVSFQRYTSGNNWNDYFEYTSTGIKEWVFEWSSTGFLAMRPFQYYQKDDISHYHFLVPGSFSLSSTDLQDKPYYFMPDWQYPDCLNGTVATLYTDDFYSRGLGMTSSYGGYIGSGAWSYDNLVYYNRNGMEWGDSLNWEVLTGIEDLNSNNTFALYPNPANEFIFIQGNFTTAKTECTIFNALGKEMPLKNISFENQSMKLDLTSILPGVYFLVIKNGNQVFTSPFMKQ